MSQRLQTKLNDSAHICGQQPCGYHASRVKCELAAIQDNLLEANASEQSDAQFHTFLKNTKPTLNLAKLFTSSPLPAGSWYLVKEQREWLQQQLAETLKQHPSGQPFKIMVAGVASYVHALGQLLIFLDALKMVDNPPQLEVTFADRCGFPLAQIEAMLTIAGLKPFLRHQLVVNGQKYKCAKQVDRALRERGNELSKIDVRCVVADLSQNDAFAASSFDLITEHFMTSLLYKNFDLIRPIRQHYQVWLQPKGQLFSADGLRCDAEVYQSYLGLNDEVGLSAATAHTQAVWDPYGLHQETFQALLDAPQSKRVPVERDNTLTRFVKQ